MRELFGKRLAEIRESKGMKQSELARAASKFLERGKAMPRDLVSKYEMGKTWPNPIYQNALASALMVPLEDLVPSGPKEPNLLSLTQDSDDPETGRLRVDMKLPYDIALEIMLRLRKEQKKQADASD